MRHSRRGTCGASCASPRPVTRRKPEGSLRKKNKNDKNCKKDRSCQNCSLNWKALRVRVTGLTNTTHNTQQYQWFKTNKWTQYQWVKALQVLSSPADQIAGSYGWSPYRWAAELTHLQYSEEIRNEKKERNTTISSRCSRCSYIARHIKTRTLLYQPHNITHIQHTHSTYTETHHTHINAPPHTQHHKHVHTHVHVLTMWHAAPRCIWGHPLPSNRSRSCPPIGCTQVQETQSTWKVRTMDLVQLFVQYI